MTALREPRPAPPAAEPPAPTFDIGDDDYVSGRDLKRILQTAASRPDTTAIELAASANLGLVRSEFANDFTRYGHEIDALVAQVPPNMRTLDNLRRVVRMVRSDHLDEIAQERANQLVAGMEPTLRPNGSAAPPAPVQREHTLESDKIPAEWLERARAAKITEDTVREFCAANGMTPMDFYKQFEKPMNATVEERSARRGGVSVSG